MPKVPDGIFSPADMVILVTPVSVLVVGDVYDQTVQLIVQFDLASQATIRLTIKSGVQHAVFHIVHFRELLNPCRVDVAVARRTGASATTFGDYTLDVVINGAFHYGVAIFHFHFVAISVWRDIGNSRHCCFPWLKGAQV